MANTQCTGLLIGDWLFEPALNRLSRGDTEVELEPLASRLLEVMASRPGQVFSTDELVESVWARRVVSDNPIYKLMATLRRALGDSTSQPVYIETIRKRGYRLIAPVTTPSATPATGSAAGSDRHSAAPVRWMAVAATVVAVLAIAVFAARPDRPDAVSGGNFSAVIAVLPFDDMSADRDQAYLGGGIAEELIHALARHPGLGVVGRTSSFAMAERTDDLRRIGRMLDARYVVEGSVRQSDDRLRVTAQLIDTDSGLHVWSGNFDRENEEILALQSSIAAQIVTAIDAALDLAPAADGVSPPIAAGLEAYDAYLRGRHALSQRGAVSAARAEQAFLEALSLQAGFVPAIEGLVEALYVMVFHGSRSPDAAYEQAKPYAELALSLAPGRAEVHVALGRLAELSAEADTAEQAYRTALEIDPDNAEALGALAWLLHMGRRADEALVAFDKALAVEPAAPLLAVAAGMNAEALGHYSCASRLYERAAEIAPDLMNAQFALGSFAWRLPGDFEAAERHLRKSVTLDPDGAIPPSFLALLKLEMGEAEAAVPWLELASAISQDSYWPSLARLAYAVYNDDEESARAAASLLLSHSNEPLAMRYLRDLALAEGDAEAAIAVYPEWLRREDAGVDHRNARLAADLAYAYLAAGRIDRATALARQVLAAVERIPRKSWQGFWLADAVAATVAEGPAAGFRRLEAARAEGWHLLGWWELERNLALDGLREVPGYAGLAASIDAGARPEPADEVRPDRKLAFCERIG